MFIEEAQELCMELAIDGYDAYWYVDEHQDVIIKVRGKL